MIRRALKGILRAAVAQPWDYQGDGAPNDWEFRVSPTGHHYAVFDPAQGEWIIMHAGLHCPAAKVDRLDEMDRETKHWQQFLSVEDPDE